MSRALVIAVAALAGLVAGALTMVSLPAPATLVPDTGADTTPETTDGTATEDTDATGEALTDPAADTDDVPEAVKPTPPAKTEGLLLVWTAGRLPDGLDDLVRSLPGVEAVTTVAGGRVDLIGSRTAEGAAVDTVDAGWAIPLDALAIDPGDYAGFLPAADQPTVARLDDGHALLGATSAQLRGLSAGDVLTLAGSRDLAVHAVVDDVLIGAAEVVVTRADAAAIGIDVDRFLLVTHTGDRAELESAIRRGSDVEVRVRGPSEAPYLRHGDAVLPQALVKASFGEFAYRLGADGVEFEQEPAWQAANLTAVEVPILGRVRCHRGIVKQLTGALEELDERGLGHLVDPDDYAGCHHARLIAPGGGVSRHAWGVAVDLNAGTNPTGQASSQDRRLVDVFARWGFAWGGAWLVPDPMHIEYLGPPDPAAEKIR